MITYLPSYIIGSRFGHCVYPDKVCYGNQPYDYLPLYEHLARKVLVWKFPYELLEDTSAINCYEFPGFRTQEEIRTTLARLFLNVGMGGKHGDFLRSLGIRR